jgi:hypothetical protein
MKRLTRAVGLALLPFAAFWVWYSIAADYDYGALSGTYIYRSSQESSTLVLNSDRTFQQTLSRSGTLTRTTGTWRRIGEGGVVFSGSFLRLPGQRSYSDSPVSEHSAANDEFYGHFVKILTVYPKLSLDGGSNELVFHKNLFH